jgi:hypothetical protein
MHQGDESITASEVWRVAEEELGQILRARGLENTPVERQRYLDRLGAIMEGPSHVENDPGQHPATQRLLRRRR